MIPEKFFGRRSVYSKGYGLALLTVFVCGLLIVGTSLQLLSGPSGVAYMNFSRDFTLANDIAQIGFNVTQADIQSKLNSAQAVDTNYCYPAGTPCGNSVNTVVLPNNPGVLGTLDVSVGTYYVSVSSARGNWYLLKAVASSGKATVTVSKLLNIGRNGFLLDAVSGTKVAYSLRRLRAAYTGPAIRVSNPANNSFLDIGFTPAGYLDEQALETFIGRVPPLDSVVGAAAAYGLRQLRTAYAGSAIQVRRSSDNALSDVGFDDDGNLNITAILNFVGTGSGYVKTWYDQSGNGRNVTQGTNSKQPRIVNAGVIETMKSHPAIRFIRSSATTLTTTSVPMTSGNHAYTFLTVCGVMNSYDPTNHLNQTVMEQNTSTLTNNRRAALTTNYQGSYGFSGESNDNWWTVDVYDDALFQTSMVINNTVTNNVTLYRNGGPAAAAASDDRTTLNVGTNGFALGSKYSTSNEFMDGYFSEAIVYNSALSTANRQSVERSQNGYYITRGPAEVFVSTWYDQSGNGYNFAQGTAGARPSLVKEPLTGRYVISFDGFNTYLEKTSLNITGALVTSFLVASADTPIYIPSWSALNPTGVDDTLNNWGSAFSGWKTGQQFDYDNVPSGAFIRMNSGDPLVRWNRNSGYKTGSIDLDAIFQATTLFDGTNGYIYTNGVSGGSAASSGSFAINNLRVGTSAWAPPQDYWLGTIQEVILYPAALSTTKRQLIENDQRGYWLAP